MNDTLDDLLKTWQPPVPEPAGFQRAVWRKLEQSRQPAEAGWLAEFLALLARPKLAFAMLALAILAGGLVGREISLANQTSDYLRSVNFYAHLP